MRTPLLLTALSLAAVACSGGANDDPAASSDDALSASSALKASDFTQPITKESIRALQTWLDDATFDEKWQSMIGAPIDFLGGADSAYHADLGALPAKRLPGGETLCHGDPKLDNFGWTQVDGSGAFGDNDFDDAGYCQVAADALRYLVATDLWFNDPALDDAALNAYVDTVHDRSNAVAIDPTTEPKWDDVRTKGLAKDTKGDTLVLGGEVQAATADEVATMRSLAAADPRFPSTVLDVTRDVRIDGGSAGFRRFWLLTQDDAGVRTIIELKELGKPGVEFGRHKHTLDGDDRLETLKEYWWGSSDPGDHFQVTTLGARFMVRDRLTRANPKPDKMTPDQITNMVEAEASALALRHRGAWGDVKRSHLQGWLSASAATLIARWRDAYAAAGGK
jgi:hypothetical protein